MWKTLLGGNLNESVLEATTQAMWENMAGKEESISQNELLKTISFFDLHTTMTVDLV